MAKRSEEVAKKAGVDLSGLSSQIKEWNGYVEKSVDQQSCRKNLKTKIEKGPFCIIRLASNSVISGGGLRCNKDLQVLRWDNQPVKKVITQLKWVDFYINQSIGGFD